MSSIKGLRRFRKTNSSHNMYSQLSSASADASRSNISLSPTTMSAENGRPGTAFREDVTVLNPGMIERPMANGQPLVQDFQHRQQPKTMASHDAISADPPQAIMSNRFTMGSDDEGAPPPPDIGSRGIHVPTRTSSKEVANNHMFSTSKNREPSTSAPTNSMPTTPDSRERNSAERAFSSGDSVLSYETNASSVGTLPPLQEKGVADGYDRLEPLVEDDPRNFDLVAPAEHEDKEYSLERRSEQILSKEHLKAIFADPTLLQKFTTFLGTSRPQSLPVLIYYLDALKALRAINYANAVAEALEPIDGLEFTEHPARPTVNSVLEGKANHAFETLARDDLPAYVSHIWVQVVTMSIHMRITGTQPPHLREASEGLAETFCLTDPSRKDNPIIFASEEFHRTTQYGVGYAIGRNCRFLQGPRTNMFTVKRLKKALDEGKEISEVILNYRRDGSTFLNLLVMAPLLDSKGNVRYFIGSQIDVSGLAKDCTDLPALKRMLARDGERPMTADGEELSEERKDEFQELSEMFNQTEVDAVRRFGGRMHREQVDDLDDSTSIYHRPRLLLKDPSPPVAKRSEGFGNVRNNGRLAGIYQHYLLVRPYPSLRILFTSPSLRVPGMLQSPFMNRIGGSNRVRDELEAAMEEGRGVTAKVRWISGTRSDDEGRSRWIHCTPLLGQNGTVGVWMVILVEDNGGAPAPGRRLRVAPPVSIINSRRGEEYNGTVSHRSSPRGRGTTPTSLRRSHIVDTTAANKFDRMLTDNEFDRQMEERERQLDLDPSRAGSKFSDGKGGNSGFPGSSRASLDSFAI